MSTSCNDNTRPLTTVGNARDENAILFVQEVRESYVIDVYSEYQRVQEVKGSNFIDICNGYLRNKNNEIKKKTHTKKTSFAFCHCVLVDSSTIIC